LLRSASPRSGARRKDIDFTNRLDAVLRARGFEPLIDRTDIYAFEQWWERIEALIRRADTVVFVISPNAVASEIALSTCGAMSAAGES
jgi:hypothetical protein